MKRDDLIFDIIEKEHQRQLKGIELIASENFVSDQVTFAGITFCILVSETGAHCLHYLVTYKIL